MSGGCRAFSPRPGGQQYFSPRQLRYYRGAEASGEDADEYISTEHLLLAIAEEKDGEGENSSPARHQARRLLKVISRRVAALASPIKCRSELSGIVKICSRFNDPGGQGKTLIPVIGRG